MPFTASTRSGRFLKRHLALGVTLLARKWMGRAGRRAQDSAAKRQAAKWGLVNTFTQSACPATRVMANVRMQTNARASAERAGAVTEVSSEEELSMIPYWQQGDATMLSEEMLEKRSHLRNDTRVLTELQRWWETAQRSLPKRAGSIDKGEYVKISRRLCKAMLAEWDSQVAQALAEEDWGEDSRGAHEMSRQAFMDCIFELADMWTKSVEADEYVEFLSGLYHRLAELDDGEWRWKREEDIEYGGYQLDDDDEEEQDEGDEEDEKKAEEPKPPAAAPKPRSPSPPQPVQKRPSIQQMQPTQHWKPTPQPPAQATQSPKQPPKPTPAPRQSPPSAPRQRRPTTPPVAAAPPRPPPSKQEPPPQSPPPQQPRAKSPPTQPPSRGARAPANTPPARQPQTRQPRTLESRRATPPPPPAPELSRVHAGARGGSAWRGGGEGFAQLDGGGLGGGGGAGCDVFGGGGGAFRHGAAADAYVAGSIGGSVEPIKAQQPPGWRPTAHSASVPARAQTASATRRVASPPPLPPPPPPPDPPLAPNWLCQTSLGRIFAPPPPGDSGAWRRAGQAAKDTISLEYRPGLPLEFQAMLQELRREKAVEAMKQQRASSAASPPRQLPPRPSSGPAASRRTPPQPQPHGPEHRPPRVQSAALSQGRPKLAPSAVYFDLGSELGLGGGLPVMRVKPKARDAAPPTTRQGGARAESPPGRPGRGPGVAPPSGRPSTAAKVELRRSPTRPSTAASAAAEAQPRRAADRTRGRPTTAPKVELRPSPTRSPSAPQLGGRTAHSAGPTRNHPFFTEGSAARPQGFGSRMPVQ